MPGPDTIRLDQFQGQTPGVLELNDLLVGWDSSAGRAMNPTIQKLADRISEYYDSQSLYDYKSRIDVGASRTDHPTNGTEDNVEIAAAIASDTIVNIKPGTYNIAAATAQVDVGDVVIKGAGKGATTLKASSDFVGGMFEVNGQAGGIRNVVFRDMTFDCNNKANVEAVILKGGSTLSSLTKVRFINCRFKNLATADRGLVRVYSGYSSPSSTDRGPVSDIRFVDCDFEDTAKYHIYVTGSLVDNVKWINCSFINSQGGCVAFSQTPRSATYPDASKRYNKNWEMLGCYFNNNNTDGITVGLIQDVQRTGIINFDIHHNYFDGQVTTDEQYCINVHASRGLKINSNVFWKTRTIMAIGASDNGSYGRPDPDLFSQVKDNTFFRCYNFADHDASWLADITGNRFIEMEVGGFGAFARHFPSKLRDNFFYNTPTSYFDASEYRKAAIVVNPDGLEVDNNTVIDDRELPDPTTAPTLTQVTGGSLLGRTYYVKYTYENDTGETLASSQATITVDAGKLLKISFPTGSSSYYVPNGAKKVNWYVSETSGSETKQGYSGTPWQWETEEEANSVLPAAELNWTEPESGLVSGSALPSSNTTEALTKYGIYELSGAGQRPNKYRNNHFDGVETPIETLGNNVIASGNTTYDHLNNEHGYVEAGYREVTVSSTLTWVDRNGTLAVDSASATDQTLPTAGNFKGDRYTVINIGSGTATIKGDIDGATDDTLAAGEAATYQHDGSGFRKILAN